MITVSAQQVATFNRSQFDEFATSAEVFLRHHYGVRLRGCTSVDLRDAIDVANDLGRARGLARRSEILLYLACACTCGLFLFEDPRCTWLFHESSGQEVIEIPSNWNIHTFAVNLEAVPGFFSEGLLVGFEELVLAAERRPGRPLDEALRMMTPERERFIVTPYFDQFLSAARSASDRWGLEPRVRDRHVLLAWLFGVQFMEDPLCRAATAFLHAARTGSGGAAS